MTLEIGARLGHYRIVGLLGRGGMADVYRAEDERLGREVALKAVPPEFARDPERVERFEREVRAAARLTHPNIVTVYEFGQGAGQHFYTMALMPGGDLKARIRAHPDGMPPAEARAVAAAMAQALDYAHRQGFVHRDVKPENILFGEDGAPQLTDFGIARAMSSGTRMTATGMSIGSPHYMSPEQARGQTVDGRSDLYSLGVVLYEMLTGRVPFDAADTLAVAYAHVNDPAPSLPPALAEWQPVMNRLVAKPPDDRYGSAGELAEILAPDALAQTPATRVMPVRGGVGPATSLKESAPRFAESAAPSIRLGTRVADATQQRRVAPATLARGALALAVVGIAYVALQNTDRPEQLRANDGERRSAVRSAELRPAPVPQGPARSASNNGGGDAPAAGAPVATGRDNLDALRRAAEQGDATAQNRLGSMYSNGRGVPQDRAEAVRWYRLAGEQGHATAQSNLGVMYSTGRGVQQDYAEAIHWYRLAAEQGHAQAQTNLGGLYSNGRGVPQDRAEAVRWYRLAAEQGHATAQSNLGVMYSTGRGVQQDYAEAIHWYRLAAEQGLAQAQTNLGVLYSTGRGVQQDYAEAIHWYRLAAEQGLAQAQTNLSVLYSNGRGVPQDYAEAIRWYRLAAEQGHARAQSNLGVMYSTGRGVQQDYAEAIHWYRLATEQGHAQAQTNLGGLYSNGRGVPQDYAEAIRWYRLAAEQGFAQAQTNLGGLYSNGRGVPQDRAEAVRWYRLAAEQGFATAQSNLGVMYSTGRGVPQDYAEAVRWYRLAAEQGLAPAQTNLGVMYDSGRGVPQDDAEAIHWYRLAAEQGLARAQNFLGMMYENGRGVQQDFVEAVRWYGMAAEQGHERAQKNLDRLR